jgi:hypothetical protein
MMRQDHLTVTIANGESLSAAGDLGPACLSAILMPASWTAADLTFQGSVDGTTFFNLYQSDNAGNDAEYLVGADASRIIVVPLADWAGIRFLKVRSGTAGSPVAQGAARVLTLLGAVL